MLKKLATGKHGDIWLAKQISTGTLVAIKELNKQILIEKSSQDAVMSEKSLLKQLQGQEFIIDFK